MSGVMNGAGSNTAVGYSSMSSLTSGDQNVAVGTVCMDSLTTGSQNTCIGYNADTSAVGSTNQIVIGENAVGQADNSVTLGNASVTAVYMAQDSGATVYCAGVNFPDDAEAGVADVNTLDAYEEGYWSIALTGSTSGSQSTEAPWTDCAYTKIGRVVHVQGEIAPNASTDDIDGSVRFSLPFAVTALTDGAENAFGTAYLGNNGTTLAHNMWSQAMTGQSYFQVRLRADDGTASYLAGSQVDASWAFGFSLTYITDE